FFSYHPINYKGFLRNQMYDGISNLAFELFINPHDDYDKLILDPFFKLRSKMVFLKDNRFLAIAGTGKCIEIIDTAIGLCIKTFSGHESIATTLSLSLDGTQLASGALDSSIKFWDI